MNAPAELVPGQKISPREAGLWTFAAISVISAHVAVSFGFQALQPPPEEASIEEAMVVELEPVAFTMAASVAPSEVISEEDVEATSPDEVRDLAEEEPPETVAEETPRPVETEETPVEQPRPEDTPVEQEAAKSLEEEAADRELVEAIEPEVVLPLPRPERVIEETPSEEPVRKVEKKAERKKTETPKPVEKADVTREAKSRSNSAVQSQAAGAPKVNPNQWNRAVQRAIASSARRVRGTRGSVSIAFVVSSSGAITSARISRSSGNGQLDSTALGIVRSARVPPPPPELSGSHSFTIPMTFK